MFTVYLPLMLDAKAGAATLFYLEQLDSSIDPLPPLRPPPRERLSNVQISIEAVSFSYPARPSVQVLNRLTLNIRQGESVALVGPSGCGKSSLAALLLRFYDANEGVVKVGGEDIRSLDVGWWRSQVGHVGQEAALLSLSILDNVRLGRPQASVEECVEALRSANALDFVMKLPEGLHTHLGDSVSLSGGQKQRSGGAVEGGGIGSRHCVGSR